MTEPRPRLSLFSLLTELDKLWREVRRLSHARLFPIYYRQATFNASIPSGAGTKTGSGTIVTETPDTGANIFGTDPMVTGTWTAPMPCLVSLHLVADAIGTVTTKATMFIKKNGTVVSQNERNNSAVGPLSTQIPKLYLATNDTVDFWLFQNTGATNNYTGTFIITVDSLA